MDGLVEGSSHSKDVKEADLLHPEGWRDRSKWASQRRCWASLRKSQWEGVTNSRSWWVGSPEPTCGSPACLQALSWVSFSVSTWAWAESYWKWNKVRLQKAPKGCMQDTSNSRGSQPMRWRRSWVCQESCPTGMFPEWAPHECTNPRPELSWKFVCNFWLPQNRTTNSLLLTESLINNINSWLTKDFVHVLHTGFV